MDEKENEFRTYRKRYIVLSVAFLFSLSNSTQWMTFVPVATTAAEYYDVGTSKINLFALMFYIFVVPMVFVATYISNRFGLKWNFQIGSALNCTGAVVKCLATSGLIEDRHQQYIVTLVGQMIAASAQSFVISMPTKASQVWFPQTQRPMATTILANGLNLGIVVAQGAIPFVVEKPSDIPTNNSIWAGLAVITEILVIIFITKGKPKTPPSKSANNTERSEVHYLSQLKSTLKNPAYVVLMVTMGAFLGIFTSTTSVTQQMLCPLGYSQKFSGLAMAGLILLGFVGAFIVGLIMNRTQEYLLAVKICLSLALLLYIGMMELYLWPSMEYAIASVGGLFGFFALGAYAITLELGVEITYPAEESISTGLLFVAGQLNGAAFIIIASSVSRPQKDEYLYLNKCNSGTNNDAKDYSVLVMIYIVYASVMMMLMVLFVNTEYKRQLADAEKSQN